MLKPASKILAFVAFAFSFLVSAISRAEAADAAGDVTFTIIGPDLKPLVNREVAWRENSHDAFDEPPAPERAMTDANGRVTLTLHANIHRLSFNIAGLGYGETGSFRVAAGKKAEVALPPLAPYGQIEGRVDRELIAPDTMVAVSYFRNAPKAHPDKQGRFIIKDVFPGNYSLITTIGDQEAQQIRLSIAPGQHLTDLVVHPVPPPATKPASAKWANLSPRWKHPPARNIPDGTEMIWVTGVVRDEAGQPVPHVDVFAAVQNWSRNGYHEQRAQTVSDAQGNYEIKGVIIAEVTDGSLTFCKEGYALAMTRFQVPFFDPEKKTQSPPPQEDFVLSSRGASLDVHVIATATPTTRPIVQLSRMNETEAGSRFSQFIPAAAEDRLRAVVDADDTAHFKMLAPGRYRVSAYELPSEGAIRWRIRTSPRRGLADGIPLAAGEHRRFDLAIYPQQNVARFALRDVDGKRIAQSGLTITSGPQKGYVPVYFDENGVAKVDFGSAGLMPVEFSFRDDDSKTGSDMSYRVRAAIAISSLAPIEKPIPLAAVWSGGATLIVQLRDVKGKPVRGTVIIPRYGIAPLFAGTTDEQGHITFTGVSPGDYPIHAYADGIGAVDLGRDDSPFPSDEALSGRSAFVAMRVVVLEKGTQHIEIRAQPIGYLRGTIVPEKGHTVADYDMMGFHTAIVPGEETTRYNGTNGEFICGPYLDGLAYPSITLANDHGLDIAQQKIPIKGGEVKHIRLSAATQPAGDLPADWGWVGTARDASKDHVFYNDGKTPACGAVCEMFSPRQPKGTAAFDTDGSGRLHMRPRQFPTMEKEGKPDLPGSPKHQASVILLPGEIGAIIIPQQEIDAAGDKPFRYILPPRISAHGRVTLAGVAMNAVKGRVRVVADYQGLGKLNSILSLDTTAQADGSFDLVGLTPGHYRVQAAIDDIWLSSVQELDVIDHDPAPLTLDVPGFGQPMLLHVQYSDGSPAIDESVAIDHADGPLASIRPRNDRTDGKGVVYLSGLSAGKHRLQLAGAPPIEIDVPPLTEPPIVIDATVVSPSNPEASTPSTHRP